MKRYSKSTGHVASSVQPQSSKQMKTSKKRGAIFSHLGKCDGSVFVHILLQGLVVSGFEMVDVNVVLELPPAQQAQELAAPVQLVAEHLLLLHAADPAVAFAALLVLITPFTILYFVIFATCV